MHADTGQRDDGAGGCPLVAVRVCAAGRGEANAESDGGAIRITVGAAVTRGRFTGTVAAWGLER